jgi:hypothetical protein
MNALRDRILELATDGTRSGYVSPTTNSLYERLAAWYRQRGEIVPISRALFYKWFGANPGPPSHQLLECVPGFAALLGVEEYELVAAAGLLRPGLDAPLTIASAARQVRQASRLISRVLTEAAVPSSGEAIIADRILHHKLDYQVSIWPVVRGHGRPLHLHSLIALKPLEPDHSKQRKKTADIERMPLDERRDHIRYNVISDGIWRSFGMMWREADAQWNLGKVPLTIELPIEERNRPTLDETVFPELQVSRLLVLGPPWAHAELMAALLADALRFGSMDLRYQGFARTERRHDEKRRFCVDRLREARGQLVWAIGEGPRLTSELTPEIRKYGRDPDTVVVVLSYGQRMRLQASRVFDERVRWIDEAQLQLENLALELNRDGPIVRAHLDDADVCPPEGQPRGGVVDRNLVADGMRHLTAQVLNLLHDHRNGPAAAQWGDRFDDVREPGRRRARVPESASWARWHEVDELADD